ncbi:MAG: tRNA glutamyl-Q(34) synthetase GluQRS [Hyphomonadaceae bacterium]
MSFTTRFAPSPTGGLHLGHAYSALLAFDAAREAGGRFLLRIEDIDQTRCRPEFERGVLEDLAWLGLSWEEPVRRQSEHFADYAAALDRLRQMGLLYRCFLTRREIAEASARAPHNEEHHSPPPYHGPQTPLNPEEENELLAEGRTFSWRLSMRRCREHLGGDFERLTFMEEGHGPAGQHGETSAHPEQGGDVILARKDTPTSYHLSVVHDDALQGVSHVIRGADLFASTHVHVLIQRLLDLPTPVYRHHRLLTGPDGKRYAKRDRSLTLAALRDAGETPSSIRARIGLLE